MLDGHVYQALGDGSVIEPSDSASAPFWVSAAFEADRTATIDSVSSWEELCAQIDALRRSENLFAAIRIDGVFDEIHYRVACKALPGTDLVTATSHQADFKLKIYRELCSVFGHRSTQGRSISLAIICTCFLVIISMADMCWVFTPGTSNCRSWMPTI